MVYMSIQIIGLENAKEMKSLRFPQTSENFWWQGEEKITSVGKIPAPGVGKLLDEKGWSAYSIQEMEQWMPKGHIDPRLNEETNRANNYALVLIDLAKTGKIKF